MNHQLPDVQAMSPDITVGLRRAGVTDVDKLLEEATHKGAYRIDDVCGEAAE